MNRRTPRPHIVHTKHPRFKESEYSRGSGLSNPSMAWKKYEEIVRIDSPSEAEISVERLEAEFDESKHRPKMTRIIQAMYLAENRAFVASRNKSLSPRDRVDAAEVARIYRAGAQRLKAKYQKRTSARE